jgi:hypothetical protein
MTLTRFVKYPGPPSEVLAIQYRFGWPLDELRQAAQHEHGTADVCEVHKCLLVYRGQDPLARREYLVVPDRG